MMGEMSPEATAEIAQALQFATSLLDGATVAYYDIDAGQARNYVLRDVPMEFHRHYLAGMRDRDPLSVAKLCDRGESIFGFENVQFRCSADEISEYATFLKSFNFEEAIEMIFRKDGVAFAGMGFNWYDNRNRTDSLRVALAAAHSYLEFNLARLYSAAANSTLHLLEALTLREQQVAELLCCGRTNSEIAAVLGISSATVKTHLLHIFDKIGAANRTCAVALLTRNR